MQPNIEFLIKRIAQAISLGIELDEIRKKFFGHFTGEEAEENFFLCYQGAVLLAKDCEA